MVKDTKCYLVEWKKGYDLLLLDIIEVSNIFDGKAIRFTKNNGYAKFIFMKSIRSITEVDASYMSDGILLKW